MYMHMYNDSIGDIKGTKFFHNSALIGRGGAIYFVNSTYLKVETSQFNGNSAKYKGGAIYVTSGASVFQGCDFTSNFAQLSDGALSIRNSPRCQILDCSFINNQATRTGAIAFEKVKKG